MDRTTATHSRSRIMMVEQHQAFSVTPTGGALGAVVTGVDLSASLEAELVARLREAWLAHQVLVFRGQSLTDGQLVALARAFGDPHAVEVCEYDRSGLLPEIDVISNIMVDGRALGALGSGEAAWHTDMSMFEYPAAATLLFGKEIPPAGGNTRFANLYAAYETLPEETKRRIEGRRSIHDIAYTAAGTVRAGFEAVEDKTQGPGAVHPVVRTHVETGRRALFLGRQSYGYIQGLPVEESDALLEELWTHMTKPEFVWEHAWQQGDLVMWDNRCLIHGRGSVSSGARRMLRRVTVRGEKPV
ncbi:TauD/TfdA family dioxygenase [Paraburkholderia heleia]|uniref:TauD/TfdA dioxygenase family protein n=1 Tax=Paraburkholderia heleia TaxID=634127 RepID=UPI0031D88723